MKKCLKQLVVYSFTSILVKCHYHPLITKKSKKWFIIYCLLLIPLTSKFLKFEKWFKVENSPNDFNILNVFYIFLKVFYYFYIGGVGKEQVPKPQLASLHWLGCLPSLASPVATLLYKFYMNQALLSGAKAAAGCCACSLFP